MATDISWCWSAGALSLRPVWTSPSWSTSSRVSLLLKTQELLTSKLNLNAMADFYNIMHMILLPLHPLFKTIPNITFIINFSIHCGQTLHYNTLHYITLVKQSWLCPKITVFIYTSSGARWSTGVDNHVMCLQLFSWSASFTGPRCKVQNRNT